MQQQDEGKASHLFLPSGGQSWSCDLSPALESFLHLLTIGRRGESMPPRTKVLGDGAKGGKKTLRLPRGFELLHLPLTPSGGLVRVVKLSEGIAPSAGLQNRACQFPSTRLLKRVGFCPKYHPNVIDRDGPRVAGRDSDGGPPPECARRYRFAADCDDGPQETPLVRRRGRNIHTAPVGYAVRGLPGVEYQGSYPVVWPNRASRH